MVSATQQTQRIRQRKARSAGTVRKRFERAHGTPKFPIHPEGYDATAAEAKPSAAEAKPSAAEAKPKAAEAKPTAAEAKPKAAQTSKSKK